MRLDGPSVFIRPLEADDAEALLALRQDNREFLTPWEPERPATFFSLPAQRQDIETATENWKNDRGYAFGIFDGASSEMIGRVALSNVVRGAWHNATLGYFVGSAHCNKGVASEAVALALGFAFGPARLHRVQAGVIPRNKGSIRVLEKNHMRHEGFSPRYLKINGIWEDHEMFAITAEEWPPTPPDS